jgi:hypothetical protein
VPKYDPGKWKKMNALAANYAALLSETRPEVIRDEKQNQDYIRRLERLTSGAPGLTKPAERQDCRQASFGHDSNHSFPRGRPHREVSFRRRRSLSLIISLISAAGRISIVPHFNFTPGHWEMS